MPPRAKVLEAPEETGPAWTDRLIGHEAAEQAFLKADASGRMPHAWLISGPKGVGKATLAYRMARFLLAQPPAEEGGMFGGMAPTPATTLQMPPEARVFRQIAQQGHPDFRLLTRTVNPKTGKLRTEIIIDDVRAVIDFLHLKPSASRWRVVIVDSADDLNRNSANALLKILEEPSRDTVLLVLAHAPQALLPTIRSRCRKLALQPLPDELIAREIGQLFPKAGTDRQIIALTAGGSLGHAIRMVEDDGAGLLRDIGALLAGWPKLDAGLLHKLGDRLAGRDQGPQFDMAVELLGWWFARMARAAATAEMPNPEIFQGEAALIGRMSAAASLDRWLSLWEKVNRLFDRVRSVNLDRKQAWVAGFLAIEGLGR